MQTVILPETTLQILDGRHLAHGLTDSGYGQRTLRLVAERTESYAVIYPPEDKTGCIMAHIQDTAEEHICLFLRRHRGCAFNPTHLDRHSGR